MSCVICNFPSLINHDRCIDHSNWCHDCDGLMRAKRVAQNAIMCFCKCGARYMRTMTDEEIEHYNQTKRG